MVLDYLLDLACPVDHGRFESLKEVFISHSSIDVRNVFFWNVELSAAFAGRAFLSQSRHEFVQVCLELLFDAVRPLILAVQLGDVLVVHLVKKIIKRVAIYLSSHDLLFNFRNDDRFFAASFDKVRNLVLL